MRSRRHRIGNLGGGAAGFAPAFALANFRGTIPTPAAPVNTTVPAISGSAYVGNTVYAYRGRWSGYPRPTYAYEWFIDAVSTGITTSSYEVQAGDDTKTLTVEVTATNSEGSAAETTAGVVCGKQPVNTVDPSISGNLWVGQTLTCANGTWTGTATITYTYQWKANGTNISGATSCRLLLFSGPERPVRSI